MQAVCAQLQDLTERRWDDVRIFLSAFRHRSFGVAARRLGVDTSTVSRRVSAFEAALGVRLFERSRDGLLPTRAAELVVPAAEAMEAAHARIAREISDGEVVAEGVVRITADPGIAELFVAPMLVGLRERHPGIEIELDASAQPRDLMRHEADLAIRSVPLQGAELVATKLGTARWVAAASPELVKRLGRVSAWSELSWITWDRDYASFAPAVWLTRHAARAPMVLRSSNVACQLTAAATGLGVGLFPLPFVRARGLRELRLAPELAASAAQWPTNDLWLVGHRALRDVPRVTAVWKLVAEEMRRVLAPARSSQSPLSRP